MTTTHNADAAREAARRASGQFGTQERTEATIGDGGVDLLTPVQQHILDTAPYGGSVGSRYDGSDVTDIAKDVRAEVKRMRAAGEIPDGWDIRVRTSRYAGGAAIDVSIDGVETEEYANRVYGGTDHRPTAASALAVARIEEYLESHNYDRSQSQTDYYDVHFYGNVTVNGGSARWTDRVCPTCVTYCPCSC